MKKKRKKLKIFLLVALVIIIGAGSYLLYEFKFKKYDVADEAVSEIVEDPYVLELPDGSKITIDPDGNVVEEKATSTGTESSNSSSSNGQASGETGTTGTEGTTDANGTAGKGTTGSATGSTGTTGTAGSTGNGTTGSNGNTPSTTPNPGGSTSEPTVGSIKEKYMPAFSALQGQADAKINALIGRAKSEYADKQAKGESINFGYFYNKYMGAAEGLEANTDAVFKGVLAAVERDLVANGFDKSYAQSFKEEYEATKKARRDSIISKAMGR